MKVVSQHASFCSLPNKAPWTETRFIGLTTQLAKPNLQPVRRKSRVIHTSNILALQGLPKGLVAVSPDRRHWQGTSIPWMPGGYWERMRALQPIVQPENLQYHRQTPEGERHYKLKKKKPSKSLKLGNYMNKSREDASSKQGCKAPRISSQAEWRRSYPV